jgi:hypothetical protein
MLGREEWGIDAGNTGKLPASSMREKARRAGKRPFRLAGMERGCLMDLTTAATPPAGW